MGSKIEFNDTLVLTSEQGFPVDDLNIDLHSKEPLLADSFKDKTFHFTKDEARIFHTPPTRVFLVQNIGGKWLHWGHVLIQSQTIENSTTSGTYRIIKIYPPEYQKLVSNNESPAGRSFF